METKNRQKVLLIAAAAGLLLLVADSLVITPLTASWNERGRRVAELKKSVSEGQQLLKQKQRIEGRWDDMRTNTLSTDVSLAQSGLLKAFERWEQDSKVKIDRIAPQWKTGEEYTTLECRADASGSIDALLKFLYDVEKDPMALKLEIVEITSRDTDGQQLALGLQLSGLILSPPQQQQK
ncbi:MAG: hypothetical protein JWR26_2502 [Pedosphaera sp.]|nr:hypothetical protein [Pedosphaera sp.]